MIRTLLIDDEPNIRNLIRDILKQHCPEVEIIGEAGSIKSGLELIYGKKPDLVLLDIRLEDGTGFELVEKAGDTGFRIIFITAHEEYALRALKLSAIDYLLKPISPEELMNAVRKAEQVILHEQEMKLKVLMTHLNHQSQQEKKIVLRTLERLHFICLHDIIRCESDSSYTTFFLKEGADIMVSRTLKEYEDLLTDSGFYRPHKSYLINLTHIKAFEKSDGGYIIMADNSKVPLSDKKKDEFFRLMENL